LIDAVFSHLKGREDLNFTVKNIIESYKKENEVDSEKEKENENDIHNDDDENENENERIVDESWTNRKTSSSNNSNNKIDPENVLNTYKGNVMLTENQMGDLLDRFGLDGFDYYFKRLADFIEKGGYVKNHYQTMLKWYEEDTQINI
jgi:hypothetical protein